MLELFYVARTPRTIGDKASRSRPTNRSVMKRAAIYVRVSTEDQAREGYSIAAQLKRLHAHCQVQGWMVADEYVDDGQSGRTVKRPEYERMMKERDQWDAILVLKMDRIHRNSRNFMAMMDDLRMSGKDFVSATDSFDTSTATGRFVMDMLQRIAQLESEQIGERVHMGMRQAAEEGKFLGMSDPYGYRFDRESGTLVIVPTGAQVVKEIHSLYFGEGWSMQVIADHLNAQNIPTKLRRLWSKRQVFRVVHNPLYEGSRHWEDVVTPNTHEAIVEQRSKRRRRRRRKRHKCGKGQKSRRLGES